MITVDWTALVKVVTVLGVGGGAITMFVKVIVFFNNLTTSVKTLTDMAVRLEASAERVAGVVTDLDKRVVVVEKLLDLDDRAQSLVRDRHHTREERRARLRRDNDRVADEIRDIMEHDKEKHDDR